MNESTKRKLKDAILLADSWLDIALIAIAASPMTLLIFIGQALAWFALGWWAGS